MSSSGNLSSLFRGGAADETRVFVQRLQEFKTQGCNILVTGNVDSYVFSRQLSKALGSSDCKQVLVSPDALTNPNQLLPDGVSPETSTVEIVDRQHARHTDSSFASASGSWLERLSNDVLDAVHRLDNEYRLDDNDLRIGVQSLNQINDRANQQAVTRFIRGVSQTAEFVNGTAYYQFQDSSERAAYLMDTGIFDAEIELRNDRQSEERWHLPEDDITTDWVEL